MRATNPHGVRIVGTQEQIPGCALVRDGSFARRGDGGLDFENAGETKLFWDDQRTVTSDGQTVFVDENGATWLAAEIKLVEEESPAPRPQRRRQA